MDVDRVGPSAADEVQWLRELHQLWTLASDVGDVTGLVPRLYPVLAALPGVRAVVGTRWSGGRVSYVRHQLTGSPAPTTLRSPVPSGEWDLPAEPGPVASVRVYRADAFARWNRPGGEHLTGAGTGDVVECAFALPSGDHALLSLASDGAPGRSQALAERLRQVCDILVASDERVRAQREYERRQVQDAFLAEASLQMDSNLDAAATLGRVARLAVPAMADGCLIHLRDENGDLVLRAHAHVAAAEQRWLGGEAAVDPWLGALVERVAEGQEAVVLRGAELGGGPFADRPRTGLVTVNPLRARGRSLGTLTFLHRDGRAGTSPAFLADLAVRAALAIDSSLIHEAQRRQVRQLQQHLLPQALPEPPGLLLSAEYKVADTSLEVGGDFYDAVTADKSTALVIGDVCGRGAVAAALTGLARHTLHLLLEDGMPPELALSRLNRTLKDAGSPRFVTAAVAVLTPDGDAFDVRVACAGHPPPLIRRADGAVEELASAKGMLLGVVPQAAYKPLTTRLEPGDTLYLYTDGLTETRSTGGAFFEDRLHRAVTASCPDDPARCAADLLAAAADFGTGVSDDTAVLTATNRSRGNT
ncbi:GAF domain-containing SpoIIE family protein phosphatase [Streptomyces sp. NPDC001941]|uniref:PP2C family protein-serine/threonine phosphatase n=1 Tax=Streptomyces sp. NPDC001941 TaxID=3154659 RepID=UPI00332CCF1D